MCNLLNVARALTHCGANVAITEDPHSALAAEKLVVPGVGAFGDSMAEVEKRGLGDAIRRYADSGRPLLGICVGMQILFDGSEEFGDTPGLAILPGRVMAVPPATLDGIPQRVPHIGWNALVPADTQRIWSGSLLDSMPDRPTMYFVHSFAARPDNPSDQLADCIYGGHRLCAAVQRDNIMATQFHPERSGEIGLEILRRFIQM